MTKPKRPAPPAVAGERVRVWSEHEQATLDGAVTEVRWDQWLYGGTHRLFVQIDGRFRDDGTPVIETYFSTRDLRTPAAPAAVEADHARAIGRGSHADLRTAQFLANEAIRMRALGLVSHDLTPYLEALDSVRQARRAVDSALDAIVREARTEGASWDQIGQALGVTRQGARQRYS